MRRSPLLFVPVLLATTPLPAGATGDVSDDGRRLATPGGSDRLVHAVETVPLPAAPSWESALVRAVGGLAFGDMDGDGDLDLCCGNYYQSGFPPVNEYENHIFFNAGSALETTPSWVSLTERHTADARVADMNGDGYEDVYFANGGSGFQDSEIFYGGPGGPPTTAGWEALGSVWTVGGALGDVNGDGFMDVVQANQGVSPLPTRPVQVFFGSMSGIQSTPGWQSADSTISNTAALADLDRGSEMVVANASFPGDDVSRIFHVANTPVAAFDRIEVQGITPGPRFTTDRAAGRIHLDSPLPAGTTLVVDYRYARFPDVAFARWVNYATAVYHNSAGTLPPTPTWNTGNPAATDRGVAFYDIDDDGDLDLALGNSGDPTTIWRNEAGVLTGPIWTADASLYYGTQDMAWGDVDGDGDEDLATIEFGNGHLRVFLNVGGTLETTPSWFYDFSQSGQALAWGDVNGDGFLDLAAGTARGPVFLFLNTASPTATPEGATDPGWRADLVASPNPFLETTTIRLAGAASVRTAADVEVIDTAGRVVRRLPPTASEVSWDGRDAEGARVAAGVYFLRQETPAGIRTGRVVRLP